MILLHEKEQRTTPRRKSDRDFLTALMIRGVALALVSFLVGLWCAAWLIEG